MPRRKNPVPSYLRHKTSNRAYVVIDGKAKYLGKYGSAVSKQRYAQLIADLLKNHPPAPATPPRVKSLDRIGGLVADIARAFMERHTAGYSKSEVTYFRAAVALLVEHAGDRVVEAFGPRALAGIRDAMIEKGWSRQHINAQVRRIRSVFRWAESVELAPAGKWFQLRTLPGLKAGRTAAHEQQRKKGVEDRVIERTIPHLSPTVAAMVRFQRLTGCRPQDVCHLNSAEIDRQADVWIFRPSKHKGTWRGQSREVYIGPRAQAVILPYITGREDAAAVFSPRLAWDERRQATAKSKRRKGYERKGPPVDVGEMFDTGGYNKAIRRAVDRANAAAERPEDRIEVWTSNMIRHRVGTDVRERHGLNAAQKLLGHKHATTTEHYASPTDAVATRIAAEEG